MMRKLLIFALVLGLASLANAGFVPLTITLNAPAIAMTGATITVTATLSGLTGSQGVVGIQNCDIVTTASGSVSYTNGSVTLPAAWNGPNTPTFVDLDATRISGSFANGDTLFSFTVTAGTGLGTLDFGLDNYDAGNFQNFLLGAINPADSSYYNNETYGPLTVVGDSIWVPEPTTIALLGLGGLLLRRRR